MIYYKYFCIILLIISGSAISDTTHVGGRVSGRFTLEGSPYIVDQDEWLIVPEDDTLTIDAGVELYFGDLGQMFCQGTLLAYGTEEDSILFDTFHEYGWAGLIIVGYNDRTSVLSHCIFCNSSGGGPQDQPVLFLEQATAIIENCYFHHNVNSIYADLEVIIRDCRIIGGICEIYCYRESTIEHCIFEQAILIVQTRRIVLPVKNCIFNRSSVLISLINECVISQSIFNGGGITWYPGDNDERPEIDYNLFFDSYGLSIRGDEEVEDFGILDRINANNDSTDRYGNLFIDPLLVGGDDFPDMYFLTDDSPCIDAGDPDSDPDPDGTITDIGAFHFHQRDIEIDPDTVLFETPGTIDSAAVTIRNVGLTALTLTSQTITPEDSPFSIGDNVGEVEIEPQSEHTTWVHFIPNEAGLYEAVLAIESNDPDEEIVEIPLIGTALNVTNEADNPPADFNIVGVYPNPFNAATTIAYSLPWYSHMSLTVHDVNGRIVETLVNDNSTPGMHTAILSSNNLASGIYIIRLAGAGKFTTRKILLLR